MTRAPSSSRSPAPPRPGLAGALLLVAALSACSSSSSGTPEKTTSDAPATSSPALSATVSGAASAQATVFVPRDLSPPAAGASREDREKAAMDLLSGNARAAELPLTDSDPGVPFEPLLRFALQTPMFIRLAKPTVSVMDEAAVSKAVEPHLPRLRLCYAGGLLRNPNLTGRVQVRIFLRAAGKPIVAENGGSDVPDSEVARCIVKAMKDIDFPAPQGAQGSAVIPVMLSPL